MIKIKIGNNIPVTGAIVVLLDSEDRVLLLLRPAEARWAPHKWGYPGGKIEANETPLEAAVRETKEETNLDIQNLKKLKLKVDKPVATYYTRDYMGTLKLDHEHDDWTWVSRSEIEQYELAPEVLEMYDWVLNHE